MPTLLDRAVRPLARRGMLSVTLPPVASVAVPDVQRAAPRTALRVSDQVGAALFRFPQRRGVLPENARHFADTNEFFRAGLNRLKDRVARAERSVEPIDPERPYSRRLQARITWLIENPNPSLASFRTFIEPVVEDLLVLGKGGWENVRNWRGWPLALYPFNAAYMRVNGDWDGTDPRMPRYFWTPVPRKAVPLANDDVTLMLLNPATHRPEGLSPLDTLQASIEADAAANQFIRSMLERYPPPGWLELGNNAGPVQVNAVREKMQTDVLGHGGMLITGGLSDAKFTSLWSGTSRDNELQAWSIYFARKICAVLGVSPQDVGVTFDINRACYSADTETLTERGWKYYWEIEDGERIATMNPETGELEYHAPDACYLYPYDGEMVHFRSRSVDVLVTPEHRMWLREQPAMRTTKPWVLCPAEEVDGRFTFRAACRWNGREIADFILPGSVGQPSNGRRGGAQGTYTGTYPDRIIPMDCWLEFLGYVISEGCIFVPPPGSASSGRYSVSLSQKRSSDKVACMAACLARLPVAFRSCVDTQETTRWQVSDKALWLWLREHVGHRARDKRIPRFVFTLSRRQLAILYNALMPGDGSIDPRANCTSQTYSTSSEGLADDVQELGFLLGYRAQRGKPTPGRNPERQRPMYRTQCNPGIDYSLAPHNIVRVPYQGMVYCFHVQNHLFVTRRNGRVGIHGNTGETQTDISEESGYESLLNVVNETINREVVAKFGNPEEINLHFQFRHLTLKRREREVEMAGKLTGGVPFTLLNEARDVARLPPLELGNAVYAMTASGPVPFIGDDARAYRRQMAEELAALADDQAQDGALPDPTATPTPDGGAANTNDQASVETDA